METDRKLIECEIAAIDGTSSQILLLDVDGAVARCGFLNTGGPSIVGNNPTRS